MEIQSPDQVVMDAYRGACKTQGCHNEGVEFDAPSFDGQVFPIICGVCGVDFAPLCKAVNK